MLSDSLDSNGVYPDEPCLPAVLALTMHTIVSDLVD